MDSLLRFVEANPAAVTGGCLALAVCVCVLANVLMDAYDARKLAALHRQFEALKRERDQLKRDLNA